MWTGGLPAVSTSGKIDLGRALVYGISITSHAPGEGWGIQTARRPIKSKPEAQELALAHFPPTVDGYTVV